MGRARKFASLARTETCGERRRVRVVLVRGARQRKGELRSTSQSAFDDEIAAHRAGKIAADRESETGSLMSRDEASLYLNERLEDRAQFLIIDPDSGVRDRDADPIDVSLTRDRDRAAGIRELDGVGEQVQQNLTDLLFVGEHEGIAISDEVIVVEILGSEERHDERLETRQYGPHFDRLDVEIDPPGFQLGEIEDVVDE